jgi:hypothetical protein
MKKSITADLIRLRFIVGYLGEQLQPAWWNSSFFAPGSTMFLAPIFSKTTTLVQYHGVKEAACRIHDERIGIGAGVFHLFRLPSVMERELHQLISDSEDPEQYFKDLSIITDAQEALASFSNHKDRNDVGPVRVGSRSDLNKKDSWRAVANYYQQAFASQSPVYPYFSGGR